jgi:hypothetical protein
MLLTKINVHRSVKIHSNYIVWTVDDFIFEDVDSNIDSVVKVNLSGGMWKTAG